jgi:hypothetical protein
MKKITLLHIAATYQVVSTVLVVERSKEGKAHGVQKASIFPQRGTLTVQTTLLALSETCIQHIHDRAKIATLLFGSPHHSSQ